tara:strand:- start:243 stop:533 length:291 start_codon:yes stop_codon:yes gene_type:complete
MLGSGEGRAGRGAGNRDITALESLPMLKICSTSTSTLRHLLRSAHHACDWLIENNFSHYIGEGTERMAMKKIILLVVGYIVLISSYLSFISFPFAD